MKLRASAIGLAAFAVTGCGSSHHRLKAVVLPFSGGKPRVIARFAGDASWNL
jgi:hypothetical protein